LTLIRDTFLTYSGSFRCCLFLCLVV